MCTHCCTCDEVASRRALRHLWHLLLDIVIIVLVIVIIVLLYVIILLAIVIILLVIFFIAPQSKLPKKCSKLLIFLLKCQEFPLLNQ